MSIRQISQLDEMSEFGRKVQRQQQTLALVPTMGALHAGHLSLVEQASQIADQVVVSIFVNPTQFAPHEDLASYPRTLDEDLAKLADYRRIAAVFLPREQDLYPENFQTYVANTALSTSYCGASRPLFFRGVCTVVLKLATIVRPDFLVFGRKDFQQLRVVEQMCRDFHLPITVVGAPLVRDLDGLALSSRNCYLTPPQRCQALGISQGLFAAHTLYAKGERRASALRAVVQCAISRSTSLVVEYLAVARQDNLKEIADVITVPSIILCAVKVDTIRLIDNIELGS